MCWTPPYTICLRLVHGGVQHILCYVLCFVCLRFVYGGVQHIVCYVLCFICLRLVYGGVQHIVCYVLFVFVLCMVGKGQYRARDNMDTHDTGRRQGTIQSQRQHGHTRHRSKARDNTEPEKTWAHTTHVVSGSVLSLAFDLCRVCPCCLWLYIVSCLRPMSCVPMLSLALNCPLPSACFVCVHVVSQHGHTRHRSKARDNTEPGTTWTHTTQVEGKGQYRARDNMETHDTGPCVSMLSLALYCPLPSTYVVCVHVVSGSVLSLAFDLCRVCPCCLWLCIVPCMDTHDIGRRQGTIQSQRQHGHTRHRSKARDNTEPEKTWAHTT
jgi:hypothetical protein